MPVVARHPAVREVMRERQRELADDGNVVIEGRDIGTVVAPHAEVKVYLNADRGVRAGGGWPSGPRSAPTRSQPTCACATRATPRACSPAEDAEPIDTTDLDVEDVVARIEELVRARAAGVSTVRADELAGTVASSGFRTSASPRSSTG